MKSRRRLAFRPGVATLIGVDALEYRQLLSVAGRFGAVVANDPAPTGVTSPSVARSDAAAADAKLASSPQAEDVTQSQAASVRPATSAASHVASEADTAAGDAGEAGARGAAMPTQPGASSLAPGRTSAVSSSAVEQTPADEGPTPIEQTPADEGATGAGAGPSVAAQPGDVNLAVGAGVLPSVAAEDVAFFASTAAGPGSLAAWPTTANVGAGAPPASDVQSGINAGPIGTLQTTEGTATGPVIAAAARVRLTVGWDVSEMAMRQGTNGEMIEAREIEGPIPPPRCAELLTEFLPAGRAMLEDAIDHFLAPLEDLGAELANGPPSARMIPAATLAAAAALAMAAVQQRMRGSQAVGDEADEDFARLPGHPEAWRLRES
jgi:hypothetical protein